VAIAAGRPLAPETPIPPEWRERVTALGYVAPDTMSDGVTPSWRPWSAGYDPDSPVDRAILATRAASFPWHGLEP